jgi:hypothetical protein
MREYGSVLKSLLHCCDKSLGSSFSAQQKVSITNLANITVPFPHDMAAAQNNPASQLVSGASLPAFNCPPGTRMHILNLGTLEVDEGWYKANLPPPTPD